MTVYEKGCTFRAAVTHIKELLNRHGAELPPDDVFDDATEQEVRIFQVANYLPSTGGVDERTLELLKDPTARPVTTPIHDGHASIPLSDVRYLPIRGGGKPADAEQRLAWLRAARTVTGLASEGIFPYFATDIPNAIAPARKFGVEEYASDGYGVDSRRGLMQITPADFARFHEAATSPNVYDPVANVASGINYIRAVYGSVARA